MPWSHFLGGSMTAKGATPEIVLVGFLFPFGFVILLVFMEEEMF